MTHSRSLRDQLVPPDGPPDTRGIHRLAVGRMNQARRQGDGRMARQWRRLVVKALRCLRFEARMRAGLALAGPTDPACPAAFFSDVPKTVQKTSAAVATPQPGRRHAFREGRWRC